MTKSLIFGLCLGRLLRGLALLMPALLIPAAEAAEPKQVLIIHSFGRDYAPFNSTGSAFRTELASMLTGSVVFREASFDAERGALVEDEQPFIEFLLSRYRGVPPDLVVAVGAPALRFHLRARPQLFPQAPLLVTGIDQRLVPTVQLEVRDRVVSGKLDMYSSARGILDLLPETELLAVVVGASAHEQAWLKEVLRELAPLSNRVQLLALGGLTLEELRQRVATLPAHSAVVYFMYALGPGGVPHENERALAAVTEASNSPVFGLYVSQLGTGIVGGSLYDMRGMGILAAKMAHRMLVEEGGAQAANLLMEVGPPVFDWRELKRWGIPESRLPPGAEVRYRPPSLWREHGVLIFSATSIVLLQAALIIALLFQRSRRRYAEKEAKGLSGRLLTAHEDERRHLARELHDDLTQRLARLAIDAGQLERNAGGNASEMRRDLVRLSEDVHALSYRLHPSVLDDLGLVEALRAECDRVASHGDVRVEVNTDDVPDAVPNEASLCLFRVAQEALNNAVRHGRASAMTVLLSARGRGLQIAVSDNGTGFDPERSPDHASLGLASMRERVRLLQGQLDIESTPGRGTTVVAWVPA